MSLAGKKILLGVCGSIAAYKAASLLRGLTKAGAEVKVLMSPGARDFIAPLTFATLSGHPVYSAFADADSGVWHSHVELGLWADLLLLAPASANTLSKMAVGLCDNLLLATFLSARCPVMIAPAMDLDMWKHPATRRNLEILQKDGVLLIPVAKGQLASGLEGEGRMAEPEEILGRVEEYLKRGQTLAGYRVVISAGPTYEAIDPVRFIGNHSSGKMGIALADKAAEMGAEVTLVLGPSPHTPRHSSISLIKVVSAAEMKEKMDAAFEKADICIMSAAVADYRPETIAGEKIKKKEGSLQLNLVKTNDILAGLGQIKNHAQLLVGFALETRDEENYARDKMIRKNLDLVVMNSLRDTGAGFGTDTNKVLILDRWGGWKETALLSKTEIAAEIWKQILLCKNKME